MGRPSPRLAASFFSALAGVMAFTSALAEERLVKDQAAYQAALASLQPGDSIVLADGEWRDFEIVFVGRGLADAPITLKAQTPGKVVITGLSNLRLGGDHLIVSGLTFRNGYSPTGEVISFRRDSQTLANNARLTEVVIDGFSKPAREEEDHWVALFGRNNRVDRNYFAGKTNRGPTMVVGLDAPESRENNHLVEHNYFGPRPPLGGNGGETIRIGVSDYSRTQSATVIARNFFERCDGEVEIISIKAEGNAITENVFVESRGSVVFRHGGGNIVSRNIFLGNGVADTGGVRIINENQTVRDNYFEGLRGEKFLTALAVMNGVPNSPENRYHQVQNALIANNSFVDVSALGFGVGGDGERSAAPKSSRFENNLIAVDGDEPVAVYADVSGVAFAGNVSNNEKLRAFGAEIAPLEFERASNGLLYPTDAAVAAKGAPRDLAPVARGETGPSWFDKPSLPPRSSALKAIDVKSGADSLRRAVENARPGDSLRLLAASYRLDAPLVIDRALTIVGGGDEPARLQGGAMIELRGGASLRMENVRFDVSEPAHAVIAAKGDRYEGAYALHLHDVDIAGDAGKVTFLAADRDTFATEIVFDRVEASGWDGALIDLNGAGFDGWYLADHIEIADSKFEQVKGPLIVYGRDGRDESTFGPKLSMTGNALRSVGEGAEALNIAGVDALTFSGNELVASGAVRIRQRVQGASFVVEKNKLAQTPALEVMDVNGEPIAAQAAR